MKLESLVTRGRYLALVLPIFALLTTIHAAGCTAGVYVPSGQGNEGDQSRSGIYGQGSGGQGEDTTNPGSSSCVTYGGVSYGSGCGTR